MTTQTLTVAYYTVQSGTGSCPFNTTKTVSGTTYVGVSTTDGNGHYYYFYPALESIDSTQARDDIDTTSLSGGTWQTVYGLGDGTTSSSPTSSSDGYIQSSGTQYINTGFILDSDTRITAHMYSEASSGFVFGARTSLYSKQYGLLWRGDEGHTQLRYNTQTLWINGGIPTGDFSVDCNKNTWTINSGVYTFTSSTFSTDYNLVIFGINIAGTIDGYFNGRVYTFAVYDDGTLIRNFIPIQIGETSSSPEYALYDISFKDRDTDNTKVIYHNDGSNSFSGSGTRNALSYTHTVQGSPSVKVFNATSNTWVDGTPYVFNGTSWVQASKVYVYNGTTGAWVEKT